MPLPAIHAGFWPAITRRAAASSVAPVSADTGAPCVLASLGARDPEARRHYWKRHRRLAAVALVVVASACGGSQAALLPQRCRLGIYFRADATPAQEDAVRQKLESDRHVTRVVFVSKFEALQIMKRRHPALVGQLRTNPFPDALYVHPRTRNDYVPIAPSLQPRPPGVETVHYPRFGPCA